MEGKLCVIRCIRVSFDEFKPVLGFDDREDKFCLFCIPDFLKVWDIMILYNRNRF